MVSMHSKFKEHFRGQVYNSLLCAHAVGLLSFPKPTFAQIGNWKSDLGKEQLHLLHNGYAIDAQLHNVSLCASSNNPTSPINCNVHCNQSKSADRMCRPEFHSIGTVHLADRKLLRSLTVTGRLLITCHSPSSQFMCVRRWFYNVAVYIDFYSASAQLAMQSAVLAIVNPSVCPSVRPSHAGTESKRLKLRSWGLHWKIAP